MPIRCVIVDDNQPFLQVARSLLEREGLEIVGVASTSAEALQLIEQLRPEIALVDIFLGEESGLELARVLADGTHDFEVTVILISTHLKSDVEDLLASTPAAGFVPKAELSASEVRRIAEATSR